MTTTPHDRAGVMSAVDGAPTSPDRPLGSDHTPPTSRHQRRAEKQRLHEAQKKARAIDKTNDKRDQGRDKQGKKNKNKKQKKRK